jgi:hypothetical protein
MFKYFKENRENKRDILLYQAFLLRTLSEIVLDYKQSQAKVKESGITEEDAMNILKNLKDVNQKDIVSEIVKSIKTSEKAEK